MDGSFKEATKELPFGERRCTSIAVSPHTSEPNTVCRLLLGDEDCSAFECPLAWIDLSPDAVRFLQYELSSYKDLYRIQRR